MGNMKKHFILFAVLSLAFTACNLTMMPEDEVSPDKYFKTESDLLLWSNQFYSNNLESAGLGSTTDFYMSNGISAYVTGGRNPATQSWSFSSLRKINYMLEHLDQCTDRAAATKYEAVGKFFRAYFYFKMVRTYGDVPWFDKVLGSSDEDVYKARDDRGFVMDKVLEDFEFAIANLPASWESGNTRVTRWAALGFASRAALYEGTFRKYHGMKDAEKYLTKAAEYGREFTVSAPFTLYNTGTTPYRDLFVSDNAITQEVVLCRHYDTQYSVFHSLGYQVNFSRASLTRRFINHYLMADGTRFTDKEGWQTMGYVGYEPIKHVPAAAKCVSSSDDTDWILLRAPEVYLNFAEALAELGTLTQSDLDISVNKIRARAGMPSLSMEAANSKPDPYLLECYPNVTRSANTGVILEIRRERAVELALEEPDRSWDMFRWAECKQCLQHFVPWYGVYIPGLGDYDTSGDGTPDVNFYKAPDGSVKIKVGTKVQDVVLSEGDKGYIVAYPANDYGAQWNDSRDYLWPIPATQRALYPDILTQNPGYVDGVN